MSDEVFGALFMRIKIRSGFSEEFGIVLKTPKTLVAFTAEKGAHMTLLVAVVDCEF